jgi:hypothetical protein
MADRAFQPLNFTLVKKKVELFAAVSVAAAGAVTLQKWNYPQLGQTAAPAQTYTAAPVGVTGLGNRGWQQYISGAEGVFSVTRVSAGRWTIKLQDNYQRLLGIAFTEVGAVIGSPVVVACSVNGNVTNMQTQGGSVIDIQFGSATGTPADPGVGSTMLLTFTLADATEA